MAVGRDLFSLAEDKHVRTDSQVAQQGEPAPPDHAPARVVRTGWRFAELGDGQFVAVLRIKPPGLCLEGDLLLHRNSLQVGKKTVQVLPETFLLEPAELQLDRASEKDVEAIRVVEEPGQ